MNDKSRDDTCNNATPVTHHRFLRQPEVLARIGVAWITLLRWEKQGLFPKRRKLGPRIVGWVELEIDEWCANRTESQSEAKQ